MHGSVCGSVSYRTEFENKDLHDVDERKWNIIIGILSKLLNY